MARMMMSRLLAVLQMMELLSSREWGLLVLDEVHVLPAGTFREVSLTSLVKAQLW